MASNFQMSMHRNREGLHILLKGNFDGSSAFELINLLKEKCAKAQKVYIHTQSLQDVHPFGAHIFKKNLHEIHRHVKKIEYRGENLALQAN